MKKLMFLIATIGFFMVGIQNASAQWEVTVPWNDSECNCGTISSKTIIIKITYLLSTPNQIIVDNEEFDITNESSPYTCDGDETILRDCEDCYLVQARVVYDDGSECCAGITSAIVDGQNLIDGFTLSTAIME